VETCASGNRGRILVFLWHFRRCHRIHNPTCNARFDRKTKIIIGNLFIQSGHKEGSFRPWSDKAHFALQHINHLGEGAWGKTPDTQTWSKGLRAIC